MEEREFISYFLKTMLEEEFLTKKNMAKALDISHRSLQLLFKNCMTAKGASTGYQRLIWYCCMEGIDITDHFHRFQYAKWRETSANGEHAGSTKQRGSVKLPEEVRRSVLDTLILCLRAVRDVCERGEAAYPRDGTASRLIGAMERLRQEKTIILEDDDMNRTIKREPIGIVRWVILEAFDKLFQRNHAAMAGALELPEESIKKAVEREQWRTSPEVIERLFAYCLKNGISLDGLMSRYAELGPTCADLCESGN